MAETPKMLPPRFDLKNKPRKKKGLGNNAPKPKELKPKPIRNAEADEINLTISPNFIPVVKKIKKVDETVKPRIINNKPKSSITKNKQIDLDNKKYVTLKFNSNDWLFTQVTALSSVIIDENGEVDPDTAKYVNDNGNCWDDKDLVKYYRTFVGAHNFKNHIGGNNANERARNSYGVVIDARLRPIKVADNKTIHYVDLLIATNRTLHPDFVKLIEDNEVRYTSMGCESSACRCTKCGRVYSKTGDMCGHIFLERGLYYTKKGGKKFRIAEQVVDADTTGNDNGFIEFIEISYLTENPAFKGAAKSYVLEIPKGKDFELTIPIKYWKKEAFQVWKDFIKVERTR